MTKHFDYKQWRKDINIYFGKLQAFAGNPLSVAVLQIIWEMYQSDWEKL